MTEAGRVLYLYPWLMPASWPFSVQSVGMSNSRTQSYSLVLSCQCLLKPFFFCGGTIYNLLYSYSDKMQTMIKQALYLFALTTERLLQTQ